MRRTFAILTLLFLVSLFIVSPAAMQHPQETPEKPLYRPTGSEAAVAGSILYDPEVREPLKIDMSADAVCAEINQPHGRVDDLVVNNRGLRNAFVYVKSGAPLNDHSFGVPESEVVLTHQNCKYSPRVLGVQVGQRFSVVNGDATFHNTHPRPRTNREWNQSQAPGSPAIVKTFTRPEQFIPVKCNQHPWEKAIVGVFAHPFFAISDQLGNYEIRGLPTGTYTLVVWHERLGEKEVEISVAGGETRRLDFTYDGVSFALLSSARGRAGTGR